MAAPNRSFAGRIASINSMVSGIENWDDADFEEGDGLLFKNSTVHSLSSRLSVRSESNTGDEDWQVLLAPEDDFSTNKAIFSAKQAGIPIPTSVPASALMGGSIKRLGKPKNHKKIELDDDWGNDLELPDPTAGRELKLKAPVPHTPADNMDDFGDFGDDNWGEGSLGIRFAGTKRDPRGGRSSTASAMSPSLGSCMTLESEDDDLTGLELPTEPMDFTSRLNRLKTAEQPPLAPSPFSNQQQRELPPTSVPAAVPAEDVPVPVPAEESLHQEPAEDDFEADFDLPATFPPLALNSPFQQSPAVTPITSPPLDSEAASSPQPQPKPADEEEDFMEGLDFGAGEVLDTRKLTLNRNIVVKKTASKPATPPAARPTASITFTDKPSSGSRIPRPLTTTTARTRLTPVYESGAPMHGSTRPMPTTTSAQYLKAKRSAPMLRSSNFQPSPRSSVPFLPAGSTTAQSHHVTARGSHGQLRRDSDPRRPLSPSMRSHSRMSIGGQMDQTPPRGLGVRRDLAPSAQGRHPPPPKKLTKPQRKRNFGDGHELDLFDDLPTSATKERQYEKTPRNTASTKTLRSQTSTSRLPMPDRMTTPLPQTPKSPPKTDNTPRFARDTAASRNAREQRLAGTTSRGAGPIAPATRPVSWQAQVAARSPHTSPTLRKKGTGQKPQLIRQMTQPFTQTEKGMVYNPSMQRWEGNEDVLVSFSQPNNSTTTLALTTASTPTFAPPGMTHGRAHDRSQSMSHNLLSSIHSRNLSSPRLMKMPSNPAPAPSPPRPALISQISAPRGVQYEGRMVFDPVKMTWLKAPRQSTGPASPMSVGDPDEEEDPFAGLDDLKDNESVVGGNNGMAGGAANADDPTFVGEEFDVGPSFIRRQREEEAVWRRRVEGWVGGIRDSGEQRGGWRWAIRDFAASASAGALENY
ncbi:hypothetical protein N0V87_002645 [Didymella glomerata]|jgi:hypothetical protein|uniref:Cytokinesis regulator n=1 Tax=Didymella glomerata TaxID=749621 RepID=A0A9W8X3W0_9PLEO|nr:hypothetical protein N0V87_002645 [Didymella glomerata]